MIEASTVLKPRNDTCLIMEIATDAAGYCGVKLSVCVSDEQKLGKGCHEGGMRAISTFNLPLRSSTRTLSVFYNGMYERVTPSEGTRFFARPSLG